MKSEKGGRTVEASRAGKPGVAEIMELERGRPGRGITLRRGTAITIACGKDVTVICEDTDGKGQATATGKGGGKPTAADLAAARQKAITDSEKDAQTKVNNDLDNQVNQVSCPKKGCVKTSPATERKVEQVKAGHVTSETSSGNTTTFVAEATYKGSQPIHCKPG